MIGYVLGNGRSRLMVPIDMFKGRTYGCNALYRDFSPSVLIATDAGIASEIEMSDYPSSNVFYTREPKHPKSRKIEYHYGYSSGPIALKYACMSGLHQVVYLIGFDLGGIRNMQNNVYSGTANYRATEDASTYYGNWVTQIATIIKEHPEINFIRKVTEDGIVPYQWMTCKNYTTQFIDDD